jgi:hypothetical protein
LSKRSNRQLRKRQDEMFRERGNDGGFVGGWGTDIGVKSLADRGLWIVSEMNADMDTQFN